MDDIYATMRDTRTERYQWLRGSFLKSGVPNANVNVDSRFASFAAGLSAAPSIDQYLDFHRGDDAMIMLGKCAIVTEILFAESKSKMGKSKASEPLPDCWLKNLFHLMAEGIDRQSSERLFKNISFICFNYDRTIELFILKAVMAIANCSYEDAKSLTKNLKIWHPYGVIGGYEIGCLGISSGSISFDNDRVDEIGVLEAARQLQTFTEGMADENERDEIRGRLATAEQIIFLGFSYLEQNMELLKLGPSGAQAESIYGTTYEMSPTDADLALVAIAESLRGEAALTPHRDTLTHYKDRTHLFSFTAAETLSKMGKTFRS